MRVNVYAEELTRSMAVVRTTADTGAEFIGLRLFLASPQELHHTANDDDRSAVTLWVRSRIHGFQPGDQDGLIRILRDAIAMLEAEGLTATKPQASTKDIRL